MIRRKKTAKPQKDKYKECGTKLLMGLCGCISANGIVVRQVTLHDDTNEEFQRYVVLNAKDNIDNIIHNGDYTSKTTAKVDVEIIGYFDFKKMVRKSSNDTHVHYKVCCRIVKLLMKKHYISQQTKEEVFDLVAEQGSFVMEYL